MGMKKFFYRVEKGDFLFDISNKFSVPVGVIISLNGLKKEIEEGDLLYIEIPEGVKYISKINDTLSKISEELKVSEDEIRKKNGITVLFPFELLII